jgi:hypothetical protein
MPCWQSAAQVDGAAKHLVLDQAMLGIQNSAAYLSQANLMRVAF